MTSLEELRTQLSDVDDQITDLYEKRMKICEDLGTCKIKNGYKTFERQREKNKIAEVMGKVSSDFRIPDRCSILFSFLEEHSDHSIYRNRRFFYS